MDLKEKDVDDLKVIIRKAGDQYLLKKKQNKLTENLEFDIDGWYIKQSEILSKLGILVYPRKWEQHHSDYGDNPFGPSDSVTWTTIESETSVVFPTQLFKNAQKAHVLKLVKKKNL